MKRKYSLKTMDLRRIFTALLLLLSLTAVKAQNDFVRGADVSWGTEMEASGKKFYTTSGQETELFALMKAIGINAVRLRVWVNPLGYGYGAWCDQADVVNKAERAHEQGLDVMIDFHYSDFFADPSRQKMPKDWSGYTFDQVKAAVADHTKEVLTALKQKGVEPKWVQVGNETTNGMIFDHGKIDWTKEGSARYTNYVALSNAGYDAVKEVFPDAYVIVHIDNAYKAADYDGWFYKEFKEAGGKFDMIGLSHYPNEEYWDDTTKSGVASNTNAANSVKTLGDLFKVPVMIVETGFKVQDADKASKVMYDLFDKTKNLPQCAGIIYWEPLADGVWKPDYYTTVGWGAYDMGAFTTDGKPTAALDTFGDGSTAIHAPLATSNHDEAAMWFDLQGRQTTTPTKGLYIMKKGQNSCKVILP